MTNAQKRALAMVLIQKAGDLVEYWTEIARDNDELADVSVQDAARVLSRWLAALPGDGWDKRLPDPE